MRQFAKVQEEGKGAFRNVRIPASSIEDFLLVKWPPFGCKRCPVGRPYEPLGGCWCMRQKRPSTLC